MAHSLSEEHLQRLSQLSNAAALDQKKWPWFLEELHNVSGGVRVQLFGHDTRLSTSLGAIEHGYDPSFLRSYEAYYGGMNPWVPAFAAAPVGTVFHGEDVLSRESLERTEFYADWVRPQGDIVGGAGAVLERSPSRTTLIGGNISRKNRDTLEAPFAALLKRVMPMLNHALQVSRMLGGLTLDNRILREGMEPAITAVFALDQTGRVHYTNRQAERLVASGDLVRIGDHARLRLTDNTAMWELSRALHDHFMPEVSISLPFLATAMKRRQYLCRTTALSEIDGSLPWLSAYGGSSASSFVLLLLAPVAPWARQRPLQPSIG